MSRATARIGSARLGNAVAISDRKSASRAPGPGLPQLAAHEIRATPTWRNASVAEPPDTWATLKLQARTSQRR
jgi:hypothetical protein